MGGIPRIGWRKCHIMAFFSIIIDETQREAFMQWTKKAYKSWVEFWILAFRPFHAASSSKTMKEIDICLMSIFQSRDDI
jgi:hypothetical protein